MESKKFFYKSFIANKSKEVYALKSQKYAVIWSQMFIQSQSKVSMESIKFFYKSFKAHQPKEGYKKKVKIMQSFGHKCSFRHNLN